MLFTPFLRVYTHTTIETKKTNKPTIVVDWFEETFGFRERNYHHTRKQFQLEQNNSILHSLANGRKFHIGTFETPSVEELNYRLQTLALNNHSSNNDNNNEDSNDTISTIASTKTATTTTSNSLPLPSSAYAEREATIEFQHMICGNLKGLLQDPNNAGSVFQVASLFNCLEMTNAQIKPDEGITEYTNEDHRFRQGPVCAVACSAGSIYRNYFVNEYGQGGKKGRQINCLEDAGEVLGNEKDTYWKMQNGYAIPSDRESMCRLKRKIYGGFLMSREAMNKIQVGVHWDTEVVQRLERPDQGRHCVTQVHCGAFPINFATNSRMRDFEPFAKLILDAAYQATFAVAAIKALESNQRVNVYLTKIGGGKFGNRSRWVVDAIRKSLRKYEDYPLNVYLVHHDTLEQSYIQGLKGFNEMKNKCVISEFISSNINVERLVTSADTTVCSNDDSTALLTSRSSSPNNNDDRMVHQISSSSISVVTKGKIDEVGPVDENEEENDIQSPLEQCNSDEKIVLIKPDQYRARRLFSRGASRRV